MALFVLLNGQPASGTSTVAERLVGRRPLALDLDIDLPRGRLDRRCDHLDTQGAVERIDAGRDEIDATVCAVEHALTEAVGGQG